MSKYPNFEAVSNGDGTATFRCPKCKSQITHGGLGVKPQHRVSHCECWPHGYMVHVMEDVRSGALRLTTLGDLPEQARRIPVHGTTWGQWSLDIDRLVLKSSYRGSAGYEIDLEEINSFEDMGFWLVHVSRKGWGLHAVPSLAKALVDIYSRYGGDLRRGFARGGVRQLLIEQ
jgi:hypothetical protein